MIEKKVQIMGGDLYIRIESINEKLELKILDFCLDEIEKMVNKLNFFDKKSKLSQLNKDRVISYDLDFDFLIKESILFYKKSKGKFNVFLGKEILNRKRDLDIEKNNFKFNIDNCVEINNSKIILNNENVNIDFGGIAKGYILDIAYKRTLQKFSNIKFNILINARGDILIDNQEEVEIEVENPFYPEITFEIVEINKGSIITSGHNRQKFKYGSHIIGNQKDIFTVTLISKKRPTYMLDSLGTWFAQESSQKVLELLEFDEYFKDIEGLIILKNGKVLKSSFWNIYTKRLY